MDKQNNIFWIIDLNNNQILYAAPGYQKYFDQINDFTTKGLDFDALFFNLHTDDQKKILNAYQKFKQEKFFNEEYRILASTDAEQTVIWIKLQLIIFDIDQKQYLSGFAEDITTVKQLNSQSLYDEDPQNEEKILQSQKMEAIGRLAGGVAHDFNNYLTTMIGYLDLIDSSPFLAPNLREYVSEIRKSTDSASALTQQLLTFSRKQMVNSVVLDITQYIKNIKNLLTRIIGEDIMIKMELEDQLWNIKADPGQIEQLLMNLIINSRDAMPHGGELTITTQNEVIKETRYFYNEQISPGHYIKLTIKDTGFGIKEDIIKNIFEPFFTTKHKGIGLGLSTVYGIVKQTNGYIICESIVDQGTAFIIYFPRSNEKSNDQNLKQLNKNLAYGQETIFIVEDEESLRKMMFSFLNKLNYMVFDARNGLDALNVLSQKSDDKIDLLITDILMPEMNGVELFNQMSKTLPELKVIFITGHDDNMIENYGLLKQNLTILKKPFSIHDLSKKIRQILDH